LGKVWVKNYDSLRS